MASRTDKHRTQLVRIGRGRGEERSNRLEEPLKHESFEQEKHLNPAFW